VHLRLDPLTAFIIGLIICKTAWDIFREASHTLTDGFDEERLLVYRNSISALPNVKRIQDIKARSHGNRIFLYVIIKVDPALNVVESHNITEEIEKCMKKEHKINYDHVHIEPMT
jgi:cation diffusion facilitator family transporter